jgi:nitronate monooxygenase
LTGIKAFLGHLARIAGFRLPEAAMSPRIPHASAERLRASGLTPLVIAGNAVLPIVQGGMGVGVSAHRLAGTVAGLGGIGTISSIDLRRLHPDLMAQTQALAPTPDNEARINAANVEALRREIVAARALSGGFGMVAVNVMRAVSAYTDYVRCSLEQGVDAVVVGAGLPLDLPDLAADHPRTALIPILSESRGVHLLLRKWEKKGRLPDAIVLEHPRWAGGHLGAASLADLGHEKFDFETVIPQCLDIFRSMGLAGKIPLIAAGGVNSLARIRQLQNLGAAGVQLGTAFAVTTECDAHEVFKKTLADAKPEDIVDFISVAGLPARAVRTPWLSNYLGVQSTLQARARPKKRCTMVFNCLNECGLRDGKGQWGQFCIDKVLAQAQRGDLLKGLFFRGAGSLPFGNQIRSAADLVNFLLGELNLAAPAPA